MHSDSPQSFAQKKAVASQKFNDTDFSEADELPLNRERETRKNIDKSQVDTKGAHAQDDGAHAHAEDDIYEEEEELSHEEETGSDDSTSSLAKKYAKPAASNKRGGKSEKSKAPKSSAQETVEPGEKVGRQEPRSNLGNKKSGAFDEKSSDDGSQAKPSKSGSASGPRGNWEVPHTFFLHLFPSLNYYSFCLPCTLRLRVIQDAERRNSSSWDSAQFGAFKQIRAEFWL